METWTSATLKRTKGKKKRKEKNQGRQVKLLLFLYFIWPNISNVSFQCRNSIIIEASLVAQRVKCLPAMQETWVQSLGQEDPLEKETATTPVLLPGKSRGQRSLVDYSPWDRKESDTTEWLHFHFQFMFKKSVTKKSNFFLLVWIGLGVREKWEEG